jgi:hypothetical protein
MGVDGVSSAMNRHPGEPCTWPLATAAGNQGGTSQESGQATLELWPCRAEYALLGPVAD